MLKLVRSIFKNISPFSNIYSKNNCRSTSPITLFCWVKTFPTSLTNLESTDKKFHNSCFKGLASRTFISWKIQFYHVLRRVIYVQIFRQIDSFSMWFGRLLYTSSSCTWRILSLQSSEINPIRRIILNKRLKGSFIKETGRLDPNPFLLTHKPILPRLPYPPSSLGHKEIIHIPPNLRRPLRRYKHPIRAPRPHLYQAVKKLTARALTQPKFINAKKRPSLPQPSATSQRHNKPVRHRHKEIALLQHSPNRWQHALFQHDVSSVR